MVSGPDLVGYAGWLMSRICAHQRRRGRIVLPGAAAAVGCRPVTLPCLRRFSSIRPRRPVQAGGRAAPPVVGMVGGGQLARMTCAAAVGLGVRSGCWPAAADESAAQVCAGTVIGDYRSARTCWALRGRLRRGDLRPRARARSGPGGHGARRDSGPARLRGAALRPGQAGHARPADRARRRRARRTRPWPGWPTSPPSLTVMAGRWCSRRSPAATTAGACGSARRPAEAAEVLRARHRS